MSRVACLSRLAALILAALLLGSLSARAQPSDWPTRSVTLLVPYPAGGSIDIIGRIIAQKLQVALGQPVVVENRAGAAGTIGAGLVARAKPDGYTLLMSASVHVISPYILKATSYDPIEDFTPISEIASGPLLIVANQKVPAGTAAEFVSIARKDPTKFVFATSGFGAAGHLAVEILRRAVTDEADKTTLVTFNGAAPALSQLMVGDIHVMIDPVLSSYPFVQSGQVKALGVTGTRRIGLLPDVPTVLEMGLPQLEFYSWYGLWAPKGTPAAIVRKLADELNKIVAMPDIQARLEQSGFEARGTTPDEFSKYLVAERDKYQRILKEADIKQR
jgi:tripartite-type tricarboxylate transporter receptor subunit TctC